MTAMTHDERNTEFRRLFNLRPGKHRIERVRAVCGMLHCSESTAWIWLGNNTKRPAPVAKLKLLCDAIARMQKGKA